MNKIDLIDAETLFFKLLERPGSVIGARLILLTMDDDDDGNDGKTRSEVYASLKQANDDRGSLPDLSSQASLASWLSFQKELDDDDQLPF